MSVLYDWNGINTAIFYFINDFHHPLYDQFMLLGAILGEYKLFALYFPLIFGFYRLFRRYDLEWKQTIWSLFAAYLLMLVWVTVLKTGFSFPRPFAILPLETVRIMDEVLQSEKPMVSFPSGHASFVMLMASGLWPVLGRKTKYLACFLVLWICLSRISLGVHFPADILGGLIISFLIMCAVHKIVRKFVK